MLRSLFTRRLISVFALTPLALSQAAFAAGWATAVQVSPTGNPDPTRGGQSDAVALGTSGVAAAVWDQFYYTGSGGSTVGVAVQSGGRWGAASTFASPDPFAHGASVSVGGDGSITAVWSSEDGLTATRRIMAARRAAGSTTWGTPLVLASGLIRTSPDPSPVRVAANATGDAWVAWSLFDAARGAYVVQAAYWPVGSVQPNAAQMLSPAGTAAIQPALALADNGTVALAWTAPGAGSVTFVKGSPGGTTWSAPLAVSGALPGYSAPMVCLDAAGLAKVAWFGAGVEANVESLRGWSGATVVLRPNSATTSFGSPSMACDSQGGAVMAATLHDQRGQVWASTYLNGQWSAAAQLTGQNPRKVEDISASQAATSPDGQLTFVAFVDHYNGVAKAIHRSAGAWTTAYTLGRVDNVASFAEVIGGAAASATSARIVWKTKGGAQHVVSDWRP